MNHMKLKNYFAFVALLAVIVTSCSDSTQVLPKASGRANEVLVVVDDPIWDAEAGDILHDLFAQEVDGLAWEEPLFDVSRVNHRNYSEMLQIARNVVYVDVSNRYSSAKVKLFKDLHASNQSFVKIQAPTIDELVQVLNKNGNRMLSFLYTTERDRSIKYFTKYKNRVLAQQVLDSIGIKMLIPSSFSRANVKEGFSWMVGGNSDSRQYLAMYSYPYVDDSTFTRNYLIKKRNEFMKANIPGPTKGSYMSTGTFYPSTYKAIKKNGKYCAELRGVWETVGDMMGGPFVSHTILDDENQRVITVEGFLYAPQKNKRNHMRQLEALLHTAHLPIIKSTDTEEE